MNVLVVGSGAREHAIAWSLARSPHCEHLYCAPGNFGTGQLAANLPVAATDIDGLLGAALDREIGLTIVGPEDPLALGLTDRFREHGLRVVGPTRAAARIESSKWWAKEIMRETGVPTARAAKFTEIDVARHYVTSLADADFPVVVKIDGLAAGKGVIVAPDRERALEALDVSMLVGGRAVPGRAVLVEEFLEGLEVSLLALTDGVTVLPLLPACDYKRAYDGEEGPNTGGMGAYAPTGRLSANEARRLATRLLLPVVRRMAKKGAPFSGVLYAGLMLTRTGPKVIEFNARFGDPETQVLLPLLETDLLAVLQALVDRRLRDIALEWRPGATVGVVVAAAGYPGPYDTGAPISGLDDVPDDVTVFHGGATADGSGGPITAGGRVLTVVGAGPSIASARDRAYTGVAAVSFRGSRFRGDIALREL